MQVVEFVDFKDIKLRDIIFSSETNTKYGVVNLTQTCIVLDGPQVIVLCRDSSFILRSKSGTLYFGIAND